MNEDELKKTLFVLRMAKNRLKDNDDFLEYYKEVESYIMKALTGASE